MTQPIKPLVSILIPTYNRAKLLPEAVESCLAQTYSNIEIVIVDDGSTDNTCELVTAKIRSEWAGKVVYHQKLNGGTSSAKNLGVDVAAGAYIQFLDSDDALRPEKISQQMAAIAADGNWADCCVCYGRLGDLSAGWEAAQRIGELYQDVHTYIQRQCERSVHIMHTEAPLWRREFLKGGAGWREDLTVAEEWEYYIRLLTRSPRIVNVFDELFWVRTHQGDQLSKSFSALKHALSFYRATRSVAELLRPTKDWTQPVRAGLLLRARTTYISMLRSGATKETLREFEYWLRDLARSVPDLKVMATIWFRRCVGRNALLMIFDFLRRKETYAG